LPQFNSNMLEVSDLEIWYGQARAVTGVCFTVRPAEIVSLLGSNGAGKTTILRGLSGLERVKSGRVLFCGENIVNRPAHQLVRLGLSHVPEGRRVFCTLTIDENIRLGGFIDRRQGHLIARRRDRVYQLFPRLAERQNQMAGVLSGGEQQMLALGRALMADPKLLILDEPSLGLSPLMTQLILTTVKNLAQAGTAVLLIEQNARQALQFSSRAYVVETGKIALEGESASLLNDPKIAALYLGGG